jgi:hypothetical protein
MSNIKFNVRKLKELASLVSNQQLKEKANEVAQQYEARAIRRIETAEKEIKKMIRTKQVKKYINTQYPKFKEKKVKQKITNILVKLILYTTSEQEARGSKRRGGKITHKGTTYYQITPLDVNVKAADWQMASVKNKIELVFNSTKQLITEQHETELFNKLMPFSTLILRNYNPYRNWACILQKLFIL